MAGIIHRRDGYYARLNVNGKRPEVKLRARSRAAAKREIEERAGEFGAIKVIAKGARMTLADAIDRFVNEDATRLRPRTRETYAAPLEFLRGFMGHMHVDEISRADLGRYRTWRQRSTDVAASTVLGDLRRLSRVLSACDAWEVLVKNPVPGFLKANRDLKPAGARTVYLNHADEDRLLAAAHRIAGVRVKGKQKAPPFFGYMLEIAIDVGLRPEELFGLEWSEVDLAAGRVHVPAHKAKGKRARFMPMLSRARRAFMAIQRVPGSPFVFAKPNGARYGDFRKPWANLLRECGLVEYDMHDLRRTCGCRLLQDHRMKMHEVSKWLGHSEIGVTERHYAFLEVDQLEDAVDEAAAAKRRQKALTRGE